MNGTFRAGVFCLGTLKIFCHIECLVMGTFAMWDVS